MKWLSKLIIFNGFLHLIDSVHKLFTGIPFKYGSTYLNKNYWYLGICLGIAIIIIGLRLTKRNKLSYKAAITLYGLIGCYSLISVTIFIIKGSIELSLIPLYFIPILFDVFIIYSLVKHKDSFEVSSKKNV